MNETATAERNRANAQHSTGPRSAAGKAVVARNALRHGVLGMAPIVPGLERPQDWQRHLQATCASLQPDGHLELCLAERIALLLWRQARITRYECHTLAHAQGDVEDDLHKRHGQRALFDAGTPPNHPDDIRMEAEDAQLLTATLARLDEQDDTAPVAWEPAYSLIDRLYDEATAGEEDADVPIPGTPAQRKDEPLDTWCERVSWTVALLRSAVAAFAQHADLDACDLLRQIQQKASSTAHSTAYALEQSEAEIRKEREQRLVPDEGAADRINRYEGTIERSLSRALRELERMQARRQGRDAPEPDKD
jgi:hypothetical protein